MIDGVKPIQWGTQKGVGDEETVRFESLYDSWILRSCDWLDKSSGCTLVVCFD